MTEQKDLCQRNNVNLEQDFPDWLLSRLFSMAICTICNLHINLFCTRQFLIRLLPYQKEVKDPPFQFANDRLTCTFFEI